MNNGLRLRDNVGILLLFLSTWFFNYMNTQQIIEAVDKHMENAHIVAIKYEDKP